MAETTDIKLQEYQADFLMADCRFPALISAWGTGKSMCGILKGMKLSEEYPGNRGVIFRREFTDLANSTMKDFTLYTGIPVSEYKKKVELPNKSEIIFLHMKELDVLKNMNIGWFLLEQAEELESPEQFDYLDGRLRLKAAGIRQGMVIANTTDKTHWLYQYWVENARNDDRFKYWQATSFDNEENLPADTIASWKLLKERNPAVYRRFVMNEWGVSADEFVLIPYEILQLLRPLEIEYPFTRRIVSVDPSQGGDECVIYAMENYRIIDKLILQGVEFRDTMKVAGHVAVFAKKNIIEHIAIDSIGIGAGIADRLRELGFQVFYVQSADRSGIAQYSNKRAEMYAYVSDMVREKRIPYPADEEAAKQLASVHYKVLGSNGQIALEKKDEVKKRIGRSPDRGDCYVYGIYHTQFCPDASIRKRDYNRRHREEEMAGSFMSS